MLVIVNFTENYSETLGTCLYLSELGNGYSRVHCISLCAFVIVRNQPLHSFLKVAAIGQGFSNCGSRPLEDQIIISQCITVAKLQL